MNRCTQDPPATRAAKLAVAALLLVAAVTWGAVFATLVDRAESSDLDCQCVEVGR